MEFQRRDRLVEVLRAELAEVLRRVKDPRLSGFLTITGVELSKDLKSAVAFYSIYGTEEERASSAEALDSAAPYIRYELKTRLRLRVIPSVRFEYDSTPERAGRVFELLTQIEKEHEQHRPSVEPPSPGLRPRDVPSPEGRGNKSKGEAKKSISSARGRGQGAGAKKPHKQRS